MDPLVCIGLRTQLKLRSLRKNLFRFGCRCETKYIASLRSQKITIHLSLLNAVLIILNIINYISKFIEFTLTFGHFKVDVIRNEVIRYFKFSKMWGYTYDYPLNPNIKSFLFSSVGFEVGLEWFSPKCGHFVSKCIEWNHSALWIRRYFNHIDKVFSKCRKDLVQRLLIYRTRLHDYLVQHKLC